MELGDLTKGIRRVGKSNFGELVFRRVDQHPIKDPVVPERVSASFGHLTHVSSIVSSEPCSNKRFVVLSLFITVFCPIALLVINN